MSSPGAGPTHGCVLQHTDRMPTYGEPEPEAVGDLLTQVGQVDIQKVWSSCCSTHRAWDSGKAALHINLQL